MPIQKIPKEDVLGAIAKLGPCQPIDIRKELKLGDTFLIGAMLSELVADGTLLISKTRRGGSPFYYDPTVPERLDGISQYLNEKDRRTYALLKQQKVMREDAQEPLVRVGLQNMPDFSKRMEHDGAVYWRHYMTSEVEAKEILSPKPTVAEIKQEMAQIKAELEPEEKPEKKLRKKVREEPSQESAEPKPEKPKKVSKKKAPDPIIMPDGAIMISPQEWLAHDTLYEKVERFAADMKIRDARVHKPHGELTCIVTITTSFGPIDTFVHAFNRKFTPEDIKTSMPRARELGLPIIILSVDAIPSKVTGAFKGMPNVLFRRFEEKK